VELATGQAGDRKLTVRASRLGGKVNLELTGKEGNLESAGLGAAAGGDIVLGLDLCSSIIRGQGGDLRLTEEAMGGWRIEIELPAAKFPHSPAGPAGPPGSVEKPLTALVVDPDPDERRALASLLGNTGHRAVPVIDAEEAGAIIGRFHFDVVFCSVHLPGRNWVEFFDASRPHVGAFVLVTEGYDADLVRTVSERQGLVLAKPVVLEDLRLVLESATFRVSAGAR
jgi:CheY-like chemotaxis protein